MKMTIDLPPEQLERLEAISKARNVSRDELVREALGVYLHRRKPLKDHPSIGSWKDARLVTRNLRDFPATDPIVDAPYEL